jgi:glycerol-3-phosphate dehydrogenase (NAD(P)+)
MKVTVLGTGGWGLTLGTLLHNNGHQVVFWTHSAEEAAMLSREHQYKDKLPGIVFPTEFQYLTDMNAALEGADMVLFVVPSQFMGNVAKALGAWNPGTKIPVVVSATKGILESTTQRMSEVILSNAPWLPVDNMVAFSGPSHAEEVARGFYTAIVAAGSGEASTRLVQQAFSCSTLRVYTSTDIVGVELCGSVKNVIAIASGVIDGLGTGVGDNTKAALITRGQAEMCRLGEALGANPKTFAGLAGMGDLIVTCMSQHSRNRYVGEHIGKGERLSDILAGMKMVAEGVPTCRSTKALSAKVGVEMPIVDAVYDALFHDKDARVAIQELMARELKAE